MIMWETFIFMSPKLNTTFYTNCIWVTTGVTSKHNGGTVDTTGRLAELWVDALESMPDVSQGACCWRGCQVLSSVLASQHTKQVFVNHPTNWVISR